MKEVESTSIEVFLRNLEMWDNNLTKIRVGNRHDGGYVILKELIRTTPEVWVGGVGDDVGFEMEFSAMNPSTKFYLFDPTIDGLPIDDPRFIFVKESLNDVHMTPAQDSLLKVDIEYNEWSFFENLSLDELVKYSQIVVEFHIIHVEPRSGFSPYFTILHDKIFDYFNQMLFSTYAIVLGKILMFFRCFHIHANNSLPAVTLNGWAFPPLLEMSFVRKDLIKTGELYKGPLPIIGLDSPNKTDRDDITNYYPMGK